MTYLKAEAVLSDCGVYRYSLTRAWDFDLPHCLFIMLNPSTADGTQDDPTIRRCVNFAAGWNYGTLAVVNLFALRSTDPSKLYSLGDVVGPENDAAILKHAKEADLIVCAWGGLGTIRDRGRVVRDTLIQAGERLHAIELGKGGFPKHPLYLKGGLRPVVFGK